MRARTPLALLPVLLAATAGASPLHATTHVSRSLTALGPALDAANALMATPWTGSAASPGLAAQFTHQALDGIAGLEGKAIVDAHGSIKNVAKWRFGLTLRNMSGAVDLKAPPGYSAASTNGFTVEAPLGSSWSFAATGDVEGEATACCNPGGKNVYSVKVASLPITLGLAGVHLAATVAVDASDPSRPTLTSAKVQARATLVSNGIFPPTPITLAASVVDGHLVLTAPLANLSVGLGQLSAKLTGSISLTLLPSDAEAGLDVPGGGVAGGIAGAAVGSTVGGIEGAAAGYVLGSDGVHLSALFQKAIIDLKGGLSVRFPDPVGRQGVDLDLSFPVYIPSTRQLVQISQILAPPLPRVWPPAGKSAPPGDVSRQAHGSGVDFGAPRDALESGIAAHVPYGAVFSIDYSQKNPSLGKKPYTYSLDADSTIWTGHYLAAEAFRYAATGGQQGLDRVTSMLAGLQRDLDVADAAVEDGKPVAVQQDGFFARATLPADDPHGLSDGPFQSRGCYYVHPPGGWTLTHGGGHYATYSQALEAAGGAAVTPGPGLKLNIFGPVAPVGKPLLYGFGCGSRANDHPISRDQYAGVFMGLAYAYKLVPPAQPAIKLLVDRMLGALIDNNWNVPLPPDGTIVTTFIGNFDAQLGLLRVGATVDSARWGALYAKAAPASALTWIPFWFSSIDPLVAYFKFNLGHAFLGPALYLETDPALRANYRRAYDILQAATSTHENAYFNLVDMLVGAATSTSPSPSIPGASLAAETASDLADWVTRWKAVQGTNQMPRNATSTDAAAFLASHFASDRLYLTTGGARAWFATFTLPLFDRVGDGMDFAWQRSPFQSGVDSPGSTRQTGGLPCAQTPPTAPQIASCSTDSTQEGPGIDFLLPYWLGEYLKVLPT